MKQKPTLDELFQSKRLDLPEDDFWYGFQDRVKGKTMAALSQQNKTAKTRRVGLYGVVPVLVIALIGWSMLQSPIGFENTQEISGISEGVVFEVAYDQLSTVLNDDLTMEREGAIQLAQIDSFDSFASARIQLSDGEENFSFHSLSASQITGSSSQYTF